jgi:hypothetical protein
MLDVGATVKRAFPFANRSVEEEETGDRTLPSWETMTKPTSFADALPVSEARPAR